MVLNDHHISLFDAIKHPDEFEKSIDMKEFDFHSMKSHDSIVKKIIAIANK